MGAKRIVVRRECDEAMARSKQLLPCDKNCKKCCACIEIDLEGNREHANFTGQKQNE